MNKLTYFQNGFVSSIEDLENVSSKKQGRILVFSDTHNINSGILGEVIENFAQDIDVLLFCGDGIDDVGEIIQESLNNEKLQEKLPKVIALVRGNNDSKSYVISLPSSEEKNEEAEKYKMVQLEIPESISFMVAGRRVFAAHGHRYCVNYSLDSLYTIAENIPADMVFYGHTHRAHYEETQGSLFLNPGSLCLPRGGQEPSFAIVTFPGITERYTAEYFTMEKTLLGSYVFSKI